MSNYGEPWRIEDDPDGEHRWSICRVPPVGHPTHRIADVVKQHGDRQLAERIRACVNCCAGLDTADLDKLARAIAILVDCNRESRAVNPESNPAGDAIDTFTEAQEQRELALRLLALVKKEAKREGMTDAMLLHDASVAAVCQYLLRQIGD